MWQTLDISNFELESNNQSLNYLSFIPFVQVTKNKIKKTLVCGKDLIPLIYSMIFLRISNNGSIKNVFFSSKIFLNYLTGRTSRHFLRETTFQFQKGKGDFLNEKYFSERSTEDDIRGEVTYI